MKIGILTFHNAHNYGALLQAYALRTKLRNMGYDAHIVNYRNEKIENSYVKKLTPKKVKISLLHPRSFFVKLQRYLENKTAKPSWAKRCDVFNHFINTVILENQVELVDKEQLGQLNYDAFICGSDQIWTDYLTGGLDSAYFLDFSTSALKLSYGASKVNTEFNEIDKQYFKEKLSDFRAVSVREEKLAEVLSDICKRDVQVVLDPTLLLQKEDYADIEEEISIKDDYVLAYFLVEDEKLMQCAMKTATELGVNLIEIHYYKQRLKKHNQVTDCGVGEFLTYIKNAKCVVTNSFHGTVFSIIYKKDFYSVYDQDSRKDNLLKMVHLENRHIKGEEEVKVQNVTNYQDVDAILAKERKKSVEYIVKALEE